MRKQHWPKREPIKNYFPLPNEIYSLGLSSTAIAVYGYLLCREDRKTYECLASYRMISEAIGKSVTTVRKYVCELEDSVLHMLHRVLKRAGLPKVRFHDLRHTGAAKRRRHQDGIRYAGPQLKQ